MAKKREKEQDDLLEHCAGDFETYIMKHGGDVYQSKLQRYLATKDYDAVHTLMKEHMKPFAEASAQEKAAVMKRKKKDQDKAGSPGPKWIQMPKGSRW